MLFFLTTTSAYPHFKDLIICHVMSTGGAVCHCIDSATEIWGALLTLLRLEEGKALPTF